MTEILESCIKVDVCHQSTSSDITIFSLNIMQTGMFRLQDNLISFALSLLHKTDIRKSIRALIDGAIL